MICFEEIAIPHGLERGWHFSYKGIRGCTDVPDCERHPMLETDYLPSSTQHPLDESRQIDLPHVITVELRHDDRQILGQHHKHSQIAMINILVGDKDSIQRRELCWRQLSQLRTVRFKEKRI